MIWFTKWYSISCTYFFKKICSKCKPQFLAKNLKKSLVLNGLHLVWPILDPKKHTFIVDYFQRPSFWVHASYKNLKFNFFSAYLVCITKVDRWVNLVFRGWNYKKLFSNNEKAAKTERNLWNNIFDYALINQASIHSLHSSLINFHCLSFNFPLFLILLMPIDFYKTVKNVNSRAVLQKDVS